MCVAGEGLSGLQVTVGWQLAATLMASQAQLILETASGTLESRP